jgi:hypothetical protein
MKRELRRYHWHLQLPAYEYGRRRARATIAPRRRWLLDVRSGRGAHARWTTVGVAWLESHALTFLLLGDNA